MILSRGRRYIFIHQPKTAGTSMALALESRAMKDDIMLGDTPKARRRRKRLDGVKTTGRLWKHSMLSDLDGLIEPDELSGLFAFTLVRNPWDRMVSYYHWLRGQSFDHPVVSLAVTHAFEDFLVHPDVQDSFARNPARRYMTDASGAERANAYIRIEHFNTDAAPLWDHLGFRLELPHANRSARSIDYRDYYSAKSRQAVATMTHEDIARFGYKF